jgi:Asp-tRNA(Asn)/Glu-tRNA(Gln) amidotransferase A subunit family amidase
VRGTDGLNQRPAIKPVRHIRDKSVSPVELLLAHLDAIERINPKVNAICTLAADSAMAAAKCAEHTVMAGAALGPLHGLPIGIKDVTATAGIRRFFEHLDETDKFGPDLKRNIEAESKLTIRDVAAVERKRTEVWNRCPVLFERIDLLLTPTTPVQPFPVEQIHPEEIASRKLATYIDWIAPSSRYVACLRRQCLADACRQGFQSGFRLSARDLRSRKYSVSPKWSKT